MDLRKLQIFNLYEWGVSFKTIGKLYQDGITIDELAIDKLQKIPKGIGKDRVIEFINSHYDFKNYLSPACLNAIGLKKIGLIKQLIDEKFDLVTLYFEAMAKDFNGTNLSNVIRQDLIKIFNKQLIKLSDVLPFVEPYHLSNEVVFKTLVNMISNKKDINNQKSMWDLLDADVQKIIVGKQV